MRHQSEAHWNAMTAEQKLTLYGLTGFGYRLLFVRQYQAGPLAVIAQQDELATIDCTGFVDYSPTQHLRENP